MAECRATAIAILAVPMSHSGCEVLDGVDGAALAHMAPSDLYGRRHTVQDDDFVAPVELVSLSRREAQGHISRRRRVPVPLAPMLGVAPHRIVAAPVAATAQLLEHADQRQLLASRFGGIAGQQSIQLFCPSPQLWSGLDIALISKDARARPQHLANRIPRHLQVSGDFSDGLTLNEVFAPNARNRLHDQHPPSPAFAKKAGSLHGSRF